MLWIKPRVVPTCSPEQSRTCGEQVVLVVDLRWVPATEPLEGRTNDLDVVVSGELDMASEPMLVDALGVGAAEHRPVRIRMDLAGVRFVDARGAGAIIESARIAQACGARFEIVRASLPVQRLLGMIDLTDLLPPVRHRTRRRRRSAPRAC
jgi:anti-anti-sigma factor